MRGALHERPFASSQRIEQLRLALLITGLAGDIAQEFAAIAELRDRKWRRQYEVGIILLLRARMMLQMIAAISAGLGKNRIGTKPLAQGQIGFLVGRQAAMRPVMHQDGKPELPRADDADRQQIGQRIRPPRHQCDRTQYQRPRMRDQGRALPGRTLPDGDQLILGEKIAGTHAKRSHEAVSPSDEFLSPRSPTRRSRAPSSVDVAVACSPSARNNSLHISSPARPMAKPSTIT